MRAARPRRRMVLARLGCNTPQASFRHLRGLGSWTSALSHTGNRERCCVFGGPCGGGGSLPRGLRLAGPADFCRFGGLAAKPGVVKLWEA